MADENAIAALVREIHNSPTQVVPAITGGGSRAIAELLEVPGGSRTLLEAVVPYSAAALDAWLGSTPAHYCSQRTARMMALAALQRAEGLVAHTQDKPLLAGIGCTASLISESPKRGPHRAHVAVHTPSFTAALSVELQKHHRSRPEEEALVATLVLNAIAEACGIDRRLELPLIAGETLERQRADAPQPWQDLLAGRAEAVVYGQTNSVPPLGHRELVFPGAFDPLHPGHLEMAAVASRLKGRPASFELSVVNVDKPPLDFIEIARRGEQFRGHELLLTRAPTFELKSQLFPGATFIVGLDTALRIADPRYYGHDAATMLRAVQQIAERGCRFLVFGRKTSNGFLTLSDVELPPELRAICDAVPETEFRVDISSTELRESS